MVSKQENERRARLMKMRDERLPDIKKQFEEAQKRNFNSNFEDGGKDAKLVKRSNNKSNDKAPKSGAVRKSSGSRTNVNKTKTQKTATAAQNKKAGLGVSVRKGEMVHHQRMLSQDVNAQATQHIIGIPVNKSRYNGYNGQQVTAAQLKAARPDPEAVRIIPIIVIREI